jgi:sigma-B regulation protein RsbU (phosphoserine phosphatase)
MRKLNEVIPMSGWCRKVRTDDDYWQQVETYIAEQTGTEFSHRMCPACHDGLMAEA